MNESVVSIPKDQCRQNPICLDVVRVGYHGDVLVAMEITKQTRTGSLVV